MTLISDGDGEKKVGNHRGLREHGEIRKKGGVGIALILLR